MLVLESFLTTTKDGVSLQHNATRTRTMQSNFHWGSVMTPMYKLSCSCGWEQPNFMFLDDYLDANMSSAWGQHKEQERLINRNNHGGIEESTTVDHLKDVITNVTYFDQVQRDIKKGQEVLANLEEERDRLFDAQHVRSYREIEVNDGAIYYQMTCSCGWGSWTFFAERQDTGLRATLWGMHKDHVLYGTEIEE